MNLVHQILKMMRMIQTSRMSIKESLFAVLRPAASPGGTSFALLYKMIQMVLQLLKQIKKVTIITEEDSDS